MRAQVAGERPSTAERFWCCRLLLAVATASPGFHRCCLHLQDTPAPQGFASMAASHAPALGLLDLPDDLLLHILDGVPLTDL